VDDELVNDFGELMEESGDPTEEEEENGDAAEFVGVIDPSSDFELLATDDFSLEEAIPVLKGGLYFCSCFFTACFVNIPVFTVRFSFWFVFVVAIIIFKYINNLYIKNLTNTECS
jgi:hypothetical protein